MEGSRRVKGRGLVHEHWIVTETAGSVEEEEVPGFSGSIGKYWRGVADFRLEGIAGVAISG